MKLKTTPATQGLASLNKEYKLKKKCVCAPKHVWILPFCGVAPKTRQLAGRCVALQLRG